MFHTTPFHAIAADAEKAGASPSDRVVSLLALCDTAGAAARVDPGKDLLAQFHDHKVTAKNVAKLIQEAAIVATAADRADQVATLLQGEILRDVKAALRDDAERILLAMRPQFDVAARGVEKVVAAAGPNPDPAAVIAAGDEAIAAFRRFEDDLATIRRIRGVRMGLAQCRYGRPEQDPSWWIEGADDEAALERAQFAFQSGGEPLVNLVQAGFRLRLNTPEEAAEVAAGASSRTRERLEAEAAAKAAAFRKIHPDAVRLALSEKEKAARDQDETVTVQVDAHSGKVARVR